MSKNQNDKDSKRGLASADEAKEKIGMCWWRSAS